MRHLANTSWKIVGLIAAGWAVAWLLASAVAIGLALRSVATGPDVASARVAAVGGGLTTRVS